MSAARPPVVVSGFGRCGTTMVMTMLRAGGIPTAPGANTHSGEHPDPAQAIAAIAPGVAVKVIEPLVLNAALEHLEGLRVVWMDRDLGNQAKSLRKFTRGVMGLHYTGHQLKRLKVQWVIDRPKSLDLWRLHGVVTIHHFEEAIADPNVFARGLADVLPEYSLDVESMAAVVHDRGPECLPDLRFELGPMGALR